MSEETTNQVPSLATNQTSLEAVLAEYLRSVEAGNVPSEADLLDRHPELAPELKSFFENRRQMEDVARPLRAAGESVRPAGRYPRIRYLGDYELLEEIATGGMGIVYKARQVSLNRIVAVKMILRGTFATEEDVKRFRAEAEAAASLQHPGIVAIHEVGLHEGQHYFSMDFVEGRSLAHLPSEQPPTARQAAEYVRDAAEAVHYAHQQGTLHRDLKPSNILIDRHDRVRITDFGLAKRIEDKSDLTLTGQILGTPSYMPPEQALGKHSLIGTASDVYSLGAVLYELLTGRPPFRGESPTETLRQVETLEPVSPRLLSPAIPRDLETICLKCLEKEPHKRYGTPQLLADDLSRFLRNEPIVARPSYFWQRGAKWIRRHPTAAALIVSSAVALLALVAAVVGQSYNARLKSLNDDLGRAKSILETRNGQLQTAKSRLEASNQDLTVASGKLEVALDEVSAERSRARRYLYAARMSLVARAEQENQPGRVVQLLRSVIPDSPEQEDVRDFEWYHLWRKYHGEESRLRGHTGPVTAVAFSPNDKWLASGSSDNSLRIWEAATGVEHCRLTGHTDEVKAIAFSPQGDQLLSASADGSLKLWNVLEKKEIKSITFQPASQKKSRMTACAFAPDGDHVAGGSEDGRVQVWRISTGESVADSTRSVHRSYGLAFHPKNGILACANEMSVPNWEPLDASESTRDTGESRGKCNTNITYSPDGKRLLWGYTRPASGSVAIQNGKVTVWDVEKNIAVWSIDYPGIVTHVAYSPTGECFAAAGLDQSVRIWNAETGEETCALFAQDAIRSIAFSSDGTRIAAGTEDRLVMLWSLPGSEARVLHEGKTTLNRRFSADANSVAFGHDGRLLCAVADGKVLAWNAITGRPIQTLHGGQYRRIALAPASTWIAGARVGALTDAIKGSDLIQLKGAAEEGRSAVLAGALAYSISHDETLVAEASGKNVATIFNVATGEQVRQFVHRDWVASVAFSPDAQLLAVGSGFWSPGADNRGALQVWNVKSGRTALPIRNFPLDVWWVAFSPDGTLLAAAMGDYQDVGANIGRIRIWNTSNWEVVHDLRGHSGCVWSLSFNPRGTRLASAAGHWYRSDSSAGEIKVWDIFTGEEVLTIPEPDGAVYGVAFSPDGRRLATASHNGAVKLLDGALLAESPTYEPLLEE